MNQFSFTLILLHWGSNPGWMCSPYKYSWVRCMSYLIIFRGGFPSCFGLFTEIGPVFRAHYSTLYYCYFSYYCLFHIWLLSSGGFPSCFWLVYCTCFSCSLLLLLSAWCSSYYSFCSPSYTPRQEQFENSFFFGVFFLMFLRYVSILFHVLSFLSCVLPICHPHFPIHFRSICMAETHHHQPPRVRDHLVIT